MNRDLEQLLALAGDRSTLRVDEPAGVEAGECFFCGCTHNQACVLEEPPFAHPCCWFRKPDHRGFAVCSNPECVKDYLADPGAP